MKIGLTGYTSEIGFAVINAFSKEGHEVIRLGRDNLTADRYYDLQFSEQEPDFSDLDAVVHLAWSWDDNSVNLLAGSRIAQTARRKGFRPILLSTYSVHSEKSHYGQTKLEIEKLFFGAGGSSLRAGLVWGGQPAGIIATLLNLAKKSIILPMLLPEPIFFHSEIKTLAKTIVTVTTIRNPNQFYNAASNDCVGLNKLLRIFVSRKLFIPIPTFVLRAAGIFASRFSINLPFRADSLLALNSDFPSEAALGGDTFQPDFPKSPKFYEWAKKLVNLENSSPVENN
jgi:dTDP-4-dehydrorhamnose reductase